MRNQHTPKRQNYIDEVFGKENELLQSVREKLQEDEKEGVHISPNEARLLQSFIKLGGIKTIVEIGTLYGYSALWLAEALPSDGHIYTLEHEKHNATIANNFFKRSDFADKITLIEGKALESLAELKNQAPFDMVFIDANKGGYIEYLNWAEECVRPGGLIVGDNTFLFGYVYGEGQKDIKVPPNPVAIMQEFNGRLSNSEKYFSSLIPTGEGMTVAVKK